MGAERSLKIENSSLEEIAKSMTNLVKKHQWDLKDLIHYFEQDNGLDYKVRVKIWEEMNGYEMSKTYGNILELLTKIIKGNHEK